MGTNSPTDKGHLTLLLVNGPNLNLLGERKPDVYGATTLADIEGAVREAAGGRQAGVVAFQSNHEGGIIDFLHEQRMAADGIVMNAGAFTHTSIALHDAIEAVQLPCVEVHISNIHAREAFRHRSAIAPACIGQVAGLGTASYTIATGLLLDYLDAREGRP